MTEENDSRVTLLYFASKVIENYIDRHPIDWSNADLAKRGGIGDQAGPPPTPMVHEFFMLTSLKQQLFTQTEFADFCFERWEDWEPLNNKLMRKGVAAKLFRNIYPSMINTLHAWALFLEHQWFDACVIDSLMDSISKHDIIVYREGCAPIALDLYIGTDRSINDRQYKRAHRKSLRDFIGETFDIPLPMSRPKRQPGNMRWYCLKDFEHVYATSRKEASLWDTPIVPCTCGYHDQLKRTSA